MRLCFVLLSLTAWCALQNGVMSDEGHEHGDGEEHDHAHGDGEEHDHADGEEHEHDHEKTTQAPAATAEEFALPSQWALFEFGDQTQPLYTGNGTEEFLKLCLTSSKKDALNCSDAVNPCLPDFPASCTEKRLKALQHAKNKVRRLVHFIQNPYKVIAVWVVIVVAGIVGIYLGIVGHYRYVNLPIVGNWLKEDPTEGLTYPHYVWMRFNIVGNSNKHWKRKKVKDDTSNVNKDKDDVYNWKPLERTNLKRPPTPTDKKSPEVKDAEQPPWTIEDILKKYNIDEAEIKTGWIEKGWDEQEQETTTEPKRKAGTRKDKYDEALYEYWRRICEWSWLRYKESVEEQRRASTQGIWDWMDETGHEDA